VPIEEILWLLFAGVLGGIGACAVAYVFAGIERLTQLRRTNVGLAARPTRPTTNAPRGA
jgi:hypothetical protein